MYTRTAIVLHWLMAILIITMLLTGEITMGDHNGRILPSVHASTGLVLFVLVCIRLLWRYFHPAPLPLTQNPVHYFLVRVMHTTLYVAMLLVPIAGWLSYTEHVKRSFGVQPASWFGYKIPLLPDFNINWHLIHNWGGKLFLLLILVHVMAAIKHHFYDKDETLKRMLR